MNGVLTSRRTCPMLLTHVSIEFMRGMNPFVVYSSFKRESTDEGSWSFHTKQGEICGECMHLRSIEVCTTEVAQ